MQWCMSMLGPGGEAGLKDVIAFWNQWLGLLAFGFAGGCCVGSLCDLNAGAREQGRNKHVLSHGSEKTCARIGGVTLSGCLSTATTRPSTATLSTRFQLSFTWT
eukprot:7997771-Alexandrium_andersonii.AAC.1